MAGLEFGQHVVGDGLVLGHPVLDGQPVDLFKDHPAGLHLVLQQVGDDPLGLVGDAGADAVAAADADHDLVEAAVIDKVALLLHPLDALQLAL